jgi:hypothetical protein
MHATRLAFLGRTNRRNSNTTDFLKKRLLRFQQEQIAPDCKTAGILAAAIAAVRTSGGGLADVGPPVTI